MNKDKDKSKKKSEVLLNTLITIFTIAIIVLIGFLAYQYNKDKNSDENKLAYTDLVKEIQAGNVEKIGMKNFLGILSAILKGIMIAISLFTSWK